MKRLTLFLTCIICYLLLSSFYPNDVSLRKRIINKAEQLMGAKYTYGSSTASRGFDCSGFVYHVFGEFDITPPRSTKDYVNLDKIDIPDAQIGDLIVFDGWKDRNGLPGHVGIISKIDSNVLCFIHSSTYKGVIETNYYKSASYQDRYLFVVNLLNQ